MYRELNYRLFSNLGLGLNSELVEATISIIIRGSVPFQFQLSIPRDKPEHPNEDKPIDSNDNGWSVLEL